MDRRIIISCVVLVVVICLVLSVVAIAGAGFLIWRSSASTHQVEESQPQVVPVLPDGSLSPAVLAEMELIQRQVIKDRGLTPQGDFIRHLFSPADLKQRVLDDFLEDYSPDEAETDVIALAAFGLVDPEFEFYDFYIELLSEQIAGFYDNETKEMVVVRGEGWGGPERLTYAHEYVHALQDQTYDIRTGLNYSEESCEDDSERCAAIQALLEGDASLSELNWFTNHASTQDRTDVMSFYDGYESPILDSAPSFLYQDFLFPYQQGYDFVEYLFDQGGWSAVDQAYVETPLSTEQILHPEKYPTDMPIEVDLPDLTAVLGDGWDEVDQGEMGEWYTYLILAHGADEAARLKEKDAAEAAKGWGGDAYIVYYHPVDNATAMVLTTVWDSPAEAKEFSDAFEKYARNNFGKSQKSDLGFLTWGSDHGIHAFDRDGAQTTWIFAPDKSLVNELFSEISAH